MVKNIKPTNTQEDPFRDEFHRLLGRLIHSIARFDFTVGLQLNWLGPHCQQDVSGLLSARQAKLGERLKKRFFVNFTVIFPLLRDTLVNQYFGLEHERHRAV